MHLEYYEVDDDPFDKEPTTAQLVAGYHRQPKPLVKMKPTPLDADVLGLVEVDSDVAPTN